MASLSDIPAVILGIFHVLALVLKSVVLFLIPNFLRYKDIKGTDVVLITGAGSGLGRQFAIKFAELGCKKLVLWDINESGLQETKSLVESPKYGARAWIYVVDVTRRHDVYSYATRVKQELGSCSYVTYLINNAGVVAGNNLLELKDESIIKTFEVNTISHFWTLKAFLPDMIANNYGHIVTVASMAGHVGCPQLTDYVSSKHAALGTHRALTTELYVTGKTGIKTTCICPFFIDTGMFAGVRSGLLSLLTTERVVEEAVSGIRLDKDVVMIPSIFYVLLAVKAMVSKEADVVFSDEVLRFLSSMQTFSGRGGNIQEKAKPIQLHNQETDNNNYDVDNNSLNSQEDGHEKYS